MKTRALKVVHATFYIFRLYFTSSPFEKDELDSLFCYPQVSDKFWYCFKCLMMLKEF